MKQRAKILTSTPVKDSLIEKENKKATKAAKTVKTPKPSKAKNAAPKAEGKQKKQVTNTAKNLVPQETNSSSQSDICLSKICDDHEDDDLNKCLVCSEFGRNNELWYSATSEGRLTSAKIINQVVPKPLAVLAHFGANKGLIMEIATYTYTLSNGKREK
ncbi:hypothetical protein HHI36_004474, partial [Cryptolaemus montrouzieri]